MQGNSKDEIAALMSSDGDYEKKLSLLKKAVVSVTKQKLELERQNAKLTDDLQHTARELAESHTQNTTLTNRVASLEAELERQKSNKFGHNVLKGISSLMAGGDDAGGSTSGINPVGGAGAGRRKLQRGSLQLSAEDVEQVVSENHNLHMQLYSLKTEQENLIKEQKMVAKQQDVKATALNKEMGELRAVLDEATRTCDRVNAECARQRAFAEFCRHFFFLKLHRRGMSSSLPSLEPRLGMAIQGSHPGKQTTLGASQSSAQRRSSLPAAVRAELAGGAIKRDCASLTTLLGAVSVLAIALKDTLPRAQRATVSDLRCFADRLAVFIDAHGLAKENMSYILKKMEEVVTAHGMGSGSSFNAPVSDDAAPTSSHAVLVTLQLELVEGLQSWLGMLRLHTPLLVECCVAYLPAGQLFHLGSATRMEQSASHEPANSEDGVDRNIFVEEVTRRVYGFIGGVEGSLEAVRHLIQTSQDVCDATCLATQSPAVRPSSLPLPLPLASRSPSSSLHAAPAAAAATSTPLSPPSSASASVPLAEWLVALQRFWWEGCTASIELRECAWGLCEGLAEVAAVCGSNAVRDAVKYVLSCVRPFAKVADQAERALFLSSTSAIAAAGCNTIPSEDFNAPSTTFTTAQLVELCKDSAMSPAVNYEELLNALAAADRTAVCYFTQLNVAIVELAEKEDAYQCMARELARVQARLSEQVVNSEDTREVLEAQIRLLSDQLTLQQQKRLQKASPGR